MNTGLSWNYIEPRALKDTGLVAPAIRTTQAGLSSGIDGLQQWANNAQATQNEQKLLEREMILNALNNMAMSISNPSPVDVATNTPSSNVSTPQQQQRNTGLVEAATPYMPTIQQASKAYGVPEDVMLAVIQTESGFKPNAVSPTGVKGLMQVTQDTYKGLGFTGDRADPTNSINAGAKLLSQLYSQYGNWDDAFAAYNGGGDAVKGLKEGNWGIWANNPNKQKEIMQYASTVNNYRSALNR